LPFIALADKAVDSAAPRRGRSLVARAADPVAGSSLAVVRVALGAVGVLSAVRIAAYGWIDGLYAGPTHRFTYPGFGWVPQPGPVAAALLVAAMAVAAAALALGRRPRVAAAAFLVAFGWIELIDAATYLNHYWFVTLLAALCVVAPVADRTVARGWVWLVRFQVGLVYAFAGLAKLQADWLVRGLPLRLWLPARADLPLAGPLLAQPGTARVLAVAGAAFDCGIVPALLWRRTRAVAWAVLVAFHVATWLLFPIGVFPWLMIGASTVFFAPDWPRRVVARLRGRPVPAGGGPATEPTTPRRRRLLTAAAAAWVVVQLALPLRHLAYPGDHRWTGEGYRFAWNVLLVERSGTVTFLVTEPATGRNWVADPTELYTPTQLRVMAAEPDLIHQAARAIAAEERARGREVEVRVDAWASLNGRPAARLIDPHVDLAAAPRDPWPDRWILPAP
jgi:vitamin K-dependent gamma-carboxylase